MIAKFYNQSQKLMNYSYRSQTVQQEVHAILCQMYDIQSLQPVEFSSKVLRFVNSGLETDIINHLMQCIKQFAAERSVKKYIYIADKMLKMPIFNQLLQHVIVQIFSDIFIYLLIQKCFNQLDQIKILRKFWVKTIHPRLLSAMRQTLFLKTCIDIDSQFKKQAIAHIKSYYQTKLQLSNKQMQFYLPKTIKTSHAVYQNKIRSNYQMYNNQHIYSTTPLQQTFMPIHQNPQHNINYPSNQQSFIQPFYKNLHQNELQGSALMLSQSIYTPTSNCNYYLKQNQRFYQKVPSLGQSKRYNTNQSYEHDSQFFKRQRLPSEQTGISFYNDPLVKQPFSKQNNFPYSKLKDQNQVYVQVQKKSPYDQYQTKCQQRTFSYDQNDLVRKQQPAIRKITHKNQSLSNDIERSIDMPKYLNIRQKLNESNQFGCKECGKSFLTKKLMDSHLDQHFEDKINQFEKGKRGKKQNNLNIDEWTNISGHQSVQFDQFYISLSLISTELTIQLKCALCDQTFQRVLKNDIWVFNNATFCQSQKKMQDMNQTKILMHKSCQLIFDESSSSEQEQEINFRVK